MLRKSSLVLPVLAAAAFALSGCGDLCSNNGPSAAPPPPPAPEPRHEEPAPPPPPPPAPEPKHEEPAPPPPPQQSPSERELVEHGRLRLENVYFETARANLLPESETSLREAGQALEKYPDLKIRVEGHTDKRGGAAYNKRLSQARANTVRDWLVSHYNLPRKNYTAVGYGFSRPENRGNSPEDLAKNRRVVLTVLNPGALPHNVELEKR